MTNNLTALQQTILAKKAALAETIAEPLSSLAGRCGALWPDADALDRAMREAIGTIANCQLLYAWDVNAVAVSSMVQTKDADRDWRGRGLGFVRPCTSKSGRVKPGPTPPPPTGSPSAAECGARRLFARHHVLTLAPDVGAPAAMFRRLRSSVGRGRCAEACRAP